MATLTIGKKLFLGVGALVLFTFALGITALVSINSINAHLRDIVDSTVKKQTLAHAVKADLLQLTGITRGMVIRGMVKDDAAQQKNIDQFEQLTQHVGASLDALDAMNITSETRQSVGDIKQNFALIKPAQNTILEAFKTGDVTGALSSLDETVRPAQERADAAVDRVLNIQETLLASDTAAASASANLSRWIAAILLALTLAVALVVLFVVRQINQVLSASVQELAQSAEQIAAAAGQVSSSSQSQAQGSSEQAATIEETSSVSVEINSMAQRNTENSKQTATIVTDSEAGFHKANSSLSEMVVAMEGISTSSQKISKIIKVIDEIAFQTNILALNAAVEAARAGEAGMGFAVVADEVRSLAQRCAQAAKDTTDLIEDSIQKSDSGMLKVDQVAVAIRDITAQSAQIKTLVDEINLGSIEQSRGIDQISTSIGQMEQVTQSSAANAEETAAAAEQLSAQARALKDVVRRISAMVQSSAQTSDLGSDSNRQRAMKPAAAGARPISFKTKSTVTFPRPTAKSHAPAPSGSKAVPAGAFPMDDDFKEF